MWRVFYIFETPPKEDNYRRVILRSDAVGDLYQTMRWFGEYAGLGRYQIMDTDPESPTAGQHLFERGSVKLSIIPVKENNDF